MKKYTWNRNVSHHRIALTKFAVIALIQATFVSLLLVLAMGIKSDGSRAYVVQTAILGLLAWVVCWWTVFGLMGVMYRWVTESDASDDTSNKQKQPIREIWDTPWYETKNGYYRGKSVKRTSPNQ
jgi:hypothetical protein